MGISGSIKTRSLGKPVFSFGFAERKRAQACEQAAVPRHRKPQRGFSKVTDTSAGRDALGAPS
jgi:hypothetical protein